MDKEKFKSIKLLVTDVDGVLTDGGIYTNENGVYMKKFNVKDGTAVKILKDINVETMILSNKESYAIVLKANNPRRSGLYQFHSYGQPSGKSVLNYLGSWTIVID